MCTRLVYNIATGAMTCGPVLSVLVVSCSVCSAWASRVCFMCVAWHPIWDFQGMVVDAGSLWLIHSSTNRTSELHAVGPTSAERVPSMRNPPLHGWL